MKKWLWRGYFKAQERLNKFLREESGEANLIAIILVIVVVIGLVAIFKDSLEQLIKDLFTKISGEAMGI